jgi:hypothetical protein
MRKAWHWIGHASTIAWLWAIGAGSVTTTVAISAAIFAEVPRWFVVGLAIGVAFFTLAASSTWGSLLVERFPLLRGVTGRTRTLGELPDEDLLFALREELWAAGHGARPLRQLPKDCRAAFMMVTYVPRAIEIGIHQNGGSLVLIGRLRIVGTQREIVHQAPQPERERMYQDMRLAIAAVANIHSEDIRDPLTAPLVRSEIPLSELTVARFFERLQTIDNGMIIIHQTVNRFVGEQGGVPVGTPPDDHPDIDWR